MLKDTRSYEFLPAQWTGRESRYVFGKHSGLSLVRHVFDSEQVPRSDRELRAVLDEVKQRSQSRAKRKHAEMYEQLRRFQAWALGGVSISTVLQMAADDEEAGPGEASGSAEGA
jgi:isopropylmalate/homocitrate/citramalate synthase